MSRLRESGNVFFTLFGAVALIGVIGVATATLVRGPLGTVVSLNQKAKVDSQLQIARKLAALDAVMRTAPLPDCDGDTFIEPTLPDTAGTCGTMLTGGGCLPATTSAAKQDAWGTSVGYCGWDHGTTTGACQIGLLDGDTAGGGTVIAVISAGPNRVFETSCVNDPTYVNRVAGSDDIIFEWTYDEASDGVGGGLWSVKSGSSDTITTDKNLEISSDATFNSGTTTFESTAAFAAGSALDLSAGGLFNLPTSASTGTQNADCRVGGGANDGVLRIDIGAGNQVLQICDSAVPVGTDPDGWMDVASTGAVGAIGADGTIQFAEAGVMQGDSANLFWDNTAKELGVGTNAPGYTLDVAGTGNITGAVTLGSTLGVTGATTLSTLNATGAVDFDSTLNVDSTISGGVDNVVDIADGLDVTGDTSLGGTLDVASDVNVNGGKFTIDSATGNTAIAGDVNVGAGNFTVTGATGNTDIAGTLTVDGITTLNNNLNVVGGASAVDFDGTLNVDGTTTITNANLNVVGGASAVDFDGTLNVDGAATLTSSLDVSSFVEVGYNAAVLAAGCAGQNGRLEYEGTTHTMLLCVNGTWESIAASGGGGSGSGGLWSNDGPEGPAEIYYNGGNVGIGTNNPSSLLNISGGDAAFNDSNLFVTGTHTGTPGMPVTGAGTRLVFHPAMSAFRAGYVNGAQWDDGNIGAYSVAMGSNVVASGNYSVAMGSLVTASGLNSTALGSATTASAASSVAMGIGTLASGPSSVAMGEATAASGQAGVAMGQEVNVGGNNSFGLGLGNASGAPPQVSGSNALGIFMGDQSGLNLATGSTMGLFGGKLMIDPSVPATQLATSAALTVDIEGDIGAIQYCDELGANCFTAASITGGAVGAPGNNREVIFNSGGVLGTHTDFVFSSAGYLGLGTANPTEMLYVSGNSYVVGNSVVGGTLGVTGATTLGSTLGVTGVATFSDDIVAKAGAQADPSVTFTGSTTTGIFSPAVNEFGVTTNGTEALRVDSSGNLLVGTQTVSGTLLADIEGQVGATEYCDEGGANCFTAADVASGALGNPGDDREVFFNSSGQLWTNDNFVFTSAGYLGLGTATPAAMLDVTGRLVTHGTHTGFSNVPISGAGSRMFFDPATGALRAGNVTGAQWDNGSIGVYSTALGQNTIASDNSSFAAGWTTTASGAQSMALGRSTTAAGIASFAVGRDAQANANSSFAFGLGTASGVAPQVSAASSLGIFMGDQSGYNLATANRMALVGGDFLIDDDGSAGSQGCFRYDGGTGKLQYSHDCTTYSSFGDSSAITAPGSDTQIIYNSGNQLWADSKFVYTAAGDLIVGSDQLDDTTTGTEDNRLFFDTSRGVFRAGSVDGAQWDIASAGLYSVAMGRNTIASGLRSVAIGNVTSATGEQSVAMGNTTVASGDNSFAMGWETDAGGRGSVALGTQADVTADRSFAFGLGAPVGVDPVVSATNSFGIFFGDQSAVDLSSSNTMGLFGGKMVIDPNVPATQLYARGVLDLGAATDAVVLPGGTTAQQPAAAVNGMIRYNTENDKFEAFQGGVWEDIITSAVAGGASAPDRGVQFNSGGDFAAEANFTYTSVGDFIVGSYQTDDTGTGSEDYRMFFDVSKGAFRAGTASGAQWDDASVGSNSFAFGYDTTASGWVSIAGGQNSVASGDDGAIAIGSGTTASGFTSVALGNLTTASNTSSVALGNSTTASGVAGVAMGEATTASGNVSMAMGQEVKATGTNTVAIGLSDQTNTDANRPQVSGAGSLGIFMDQTDFYDLSATDTFAIIGGEIMIDDDGNSDTSHGCFRFDDASGKLQYSHDCTTYSTFGDASSVTAPGSDTQIIYNSGNQLWADVNFNYTSVGDFIVGSYQIEDTGTGFEDKRMFFDVSKGAFRAGAAAGNQWDYASSGLYSAAFGRNTIASGMWSMAAGNGTTASGNSSTAMGSSSTASGTYSVAIGENAAASGSSSVALGRNTVASQNYATAIGNGSVASGIGSTAMGFITTASGANSMAMGSSTTASGDTSTTMGSNTTAGGANSIAIGQEVKATGVQNTMAIGLADQTAVDANRPQVSGEGSLGIFMDQVDTYDLSDTDTLGVIGGKIMIDDDGTSPATRGCFRFDDASGKLQYSHDCTSYATFGDASSVTAPGSDTQIIYNSGNQLWADVNFNYTSVGDLIVGSYQTDDTGTGSEDSRMFFDTSKGAFRAGRVTGAQWDNANVGQYSVAIGIETMANAFGSVAIGANATSTGWGSAAIGLNTTASADYGAMAMGNEVKAAGVQYTMAIGLSDQTNTDANRPQVSGEGSLGIFMDQVDLYDLSATDTLGIIGGGIMIDSDGSGDTPATSLQTDGTIKMGWGNESCDASREGAIHYNSGDNNFYLCKTAGSWSVIATGTPSAAAPDRGVQFNSGGNFAAEANFTYTSVGDFIVGSYQTGDTGTGSEDSRMFFDVSKGAFRAGQAAADEWDDANVGTASMAMGWNAKASGISSMAFGPTATASASSAVAVGAGTTASASFSTALGKDTTASASYSTAMGYTTTASGQYSIAAGRQTNAVGDNSVAMGYITTANGISSIALGNSLSANGNYSLATGTNTNASGNVSTALGGYTTASGFYSFAAGGNNIAAGDYSTALGREVNITATGDYSMGIGLVSSVVFPDPQISGQQSLGIFMGNQAGIDFASSNTMGLFGGRMVIDPAVPATNLFASTGEQLLELDVAGDIGAQNYCDDAGNDCFTAAGIALLAGGSVPAHGSDTQIQYNSGNQFWSDANFTYTSVGDLIVGSYQIEDTGTGSEDVRMYFDVSKGAFRAGKAIGTHWDYTSTGLYSVAFGQNTVASNINSVAMGVLATASGLTSTAIGASAKASGNYSVAIGQTTQATGQSSVVLGHGSVASGLDSFSFGQLATASGNYSQAFGISTTASGAKSTTMGANVIAGNGTAANGLGDGSFAFGLMDDAVAITTKPQVTGIQSFGIFMGDQDGGIDLASANTMGLFGGRMVIDPAVPATDMVADVALDVNGTIKVADGGESCAASTAGGIRYGSNSLYYCDGTTWQTIANGGDTGLWTDNTTHISYESAHIVKIGQTSTTTGLDGDGGRMFYDPNKSAMRGGAISGANDAWQDANIGAYSLAWGENNEANQSSTIALGSGNTAGATTAGGAAIAIGTNNIAGGVGATGGIAIGRGGTSTGDWSIVLGSYNVASRHPSYAFGEYNTASGDHTFALGYYNTASTHGAYNMAIGREAQVSGTSSMAIGVGNPADGSRPIVSGDNALGIFMDAQDGINFASANTMGLFGGKMVIDPAVPATQLTARGVLDLGAATDAIVLPAGATGDRPTAGVNGMLRYNSTSGKFEGYQAGSWQDIVTGAAGGSASAPDRGIQFNSGGDFTAESTFTYTSVGRLGLGTADPDYGLHVKYNGPVPELGIDSGNANWTTWSWIRGMHLGQSVAMRFKGNTGPYYFMGSKNDSFFMGTATVDDNTAPPSYHFTMSSAGNIGLGTGLNLPVTQLDVNGTVKIAYGGESCAASTEGAIRYDSGSSIMELCDGASWLAINTGVGGKWADGAGGDIYYNSGNVGIGTGTPGSELEVVGVVQADGLLLDGVTGLPDPTTNLVDVLNDLSDTSVAAPSSGDVLTWNGSNWVNSAVAGGLWTAGTGDDIYYNSGTPMVGIGTTDPVVSLDLGSTTDAILLPSGVTGDRPGTGVNGMLRYNSTSGKFEGYQAGSWQDIVTGAAGGSVAAPGRGIQFNSGGSFAAEANFTYTSVGDLIVGSYQTGDTGNAAEDNRMFFDKSKGAFRAGTVSGAQWDDANIGQYSLAMGVDTTASGYASTAMGDSTTASNTSSTAMGSSTTASGWTAIALGNSSTASGNSSTAMGGHTTASGERSTAMGSFTTASGFASTAMGSYTSSGAYSMAIGLSSVNPATDPTVTGQQSLGIFMGNQNAVALSSSNTMGLFGGKFVIDPAIPATNLSADTALEIEGTLKIAYGGESCDAARAGAIRYDSGSGQFDLCDGVSGWLSIATSSGGSKWQDGAAGAIYYNSGNVGVGTATPAEAVDVVGSVQVSDSIIITGTTGAAPTSNLVDVLDDLSDTSVAAPSSGDVLTWNGTNWVSSAVAGGVWSAGAGDDIYYNSGTPMVGIGTTNPTVTLDVVGDIQYTGSLTDLSDRRLKTDITPLDTADMVAKLMQVDTYSFRMKDDPKGALEFGVMAQELETVFPELVKTADDEMGTKSVNYIGLIAPLIETTQALKAENDDLRAALDEMKAQQNAEFEDALDELRREVKGLKAYTGYGIDRASFEGWMLWALLAALAGGAGLSFAAGALRRRRT
ncbi:MAG: tail fiber domain-containing protein [Rhodospirillales bacterium]|nr:tail fiber domain-containing protein [Rhodospirillales bacterium]